MISKDQEHPLDLEQYRQLGTDLGEQ